MRRVRRSTHELRLVPLLAGQFVSCPKLVYVSYLNCDWICGCTALIARVFKHSLAHFARLFLQNRDVSVNHSEQDQGDQGG